MRGMGVLPKNYVYLIKKIIMPKEVKITDNTMVYDPSAGKNVRGPWWNKGESSMTKVTTVTKGGKVKKKTESSAWDVLDKGKLNKNREVNVNKYNKAGELKKKVSLTSVNGVSKKVVSKPGEADKTKRVGVVAKVRLKKNI